MTCQADAPAPSGPASWERRFVTMSAWFAGAVVALGILVLLGWILDVRTLTQLHPGLASMKANTAVLLVVLGVGLWVGRSRDARSVRVRRILGLVVMLGAAATLAEYVFDVDLGIDELVFRDPQHPDPGRMAPATALTLLLLGCALVFQDGHRVSGLARAAALCAAASALIALYGYVFGAPSLYDIGPYTGVAPHTAIGLLLATCAFLMARPHQGIVGLLTGDTEAGHVMRRLLPAIALVPLVLGWLRLLGQEAGYFDTRFGIALTVLSTTISLAFFSSFVAASLRRSELRRRDIEAARQQLLEQNERAQRQLEVEADAMARLNRIASLFLPKSAPLQPVLMEVVDTAIAISGADFGEIQILDPRSSELHLVAHRGLPDSWLAYRDHDARRGTCGIALERGKRIVVEDVDESPIFAGTPALELQRRVGIRAVQSTPLFARSGAPLGTFSTHYTRPHRPDERTLRLLDLVAREAADIIDRARADQQLRESEQRFRALVDASAQIEWTTDATGSTMEDSPSWRAFTGQSYEQMRGTGWLDALHPDDRDRVAQAWRDAVRARNRFAIEFRVRHASGAWRWTAVNAVPLFDATGELSGWIGMNTDITSRKQLEAGREQQLRQMVENAPYSVALLDRDLRYVQASPRWMFNYGIGRDAIGKRHYDLFPELPAHWKEVHRRCLAGATVSSDGEPFVRSNGTIQWVRWKVCPWRDLDGAIAGIVMYGEDITEQRQAAEAVRAAEEQLRLAQRVARVGTFEWNVPTGTNTWTPEMEQMYGLPVGGFAKTQSAWEDLVHPDDRAHARRSVERAFETGLPVEDEWRVRWPDGSVHWLSGRFQGFRDDEGRPLRLIGVNIEITERKQADEQREQLLHDIRDLTRNLETRVVERTKEVEIARDRLDGIISMAADAIISIDGDQRITIFNRGAEQIFGWTRNEVLGKPLDMLLPDGLRAVHRQHVAGFATDPIKARRMGERMTVEGLRKNGDTFPAEAAISKLSTDAGFQFTAILRDITERKQHENEQARAHAERALLLKEIHHRVKNNLQVISSLFYLQAQRTEQESVRRLLEESRSRLQSIAIIHEKLYRSEQLASIDFDDYLRELTASLVRAIGVQAPNVEVRVDAANVVLDIDRAIPCALIVNELISNSLKHAFPAGRRGEVRVALRAVGTGYQLEVGDTGIGFPDDLDFRTVTTLGLQLVVSLTKQLRGTIELGRRDGTTFTIAFPATAAAHRADVAMQA